MKKAAYRAIEDYMLASMRDTAHDSQHIYRVIYHALDIAQTEGNVDYEILLTACLLHDIGREAEFKDPKSCHAVIGGRMAYDYLRDAGWSEGRAGHVRDCITSHRFRNDHSPDTIEAKILFDADKLEAAGIIGLARTFIYKGQVSHPIYTLTPDGLVSDGTDSDTPSFFHEYNYKLKTIYSTFHTKRAMEIAESRRQGAIDMYNTLLGEVRSTYNIGVPLLERVFEE